MTVLLLALYALFCIGYGTAVAFSYGIPKGVLFALLAPFFIGGELAHRTILS